MHRSNRREFVRLGLGLLAGCATAGRAMAEGEAAEPGKKRLVEYSNPRKYKITHRGTITNGNVALRSLEIWLPVPQNQPEQDVANLTVKPKVNVVPDVTGQAMVAKRCATTGLPGPNGAWSLELSYELTCRRIRTNPAALREAKFGPYLQNREVQLFTRPEKYIETRDPDIIREANKFKEKYKDPISLARAAYDWVLEKTEYRLIDGMGGAAFCLKKGYGECGDYSALLVAVLRVAGVPARTVAGFWAHRTNGWHVWAEFMLPTGEWVPVDASVGDQGWWSRDYYFGSLDNRRVAVCKTLDIELAGKQPGESKANFLQSGAFWWQAQHLRPDSRKPSDEWTVVGEPLPES
jgi:hypothetical protein